MSTLLLNTTLDGTVVSVWNLIYTSNGIFIAGQSEVSTKNPTRKA